MYELSGAMGGHYKLTSRCVGFVGEFSARRYADHSIRIQNQNDVSFSKNST